MPQKFHALKISCLKHYLEYNLEYHHSGNEAVFTLTLKKLFANKILRRLSKSQKLLQSKKLNEKKNKKKKTTTTTTTTTHFLPTIFIIHYFKVLLGCLGVVDHIHLKKLN